MLAAMTDGPTSANSSPQAAPMQPAKQICSELLRRELLLVTGKGGVGKSTVAQALARQAAAQGKRVLLVELESVSRAGPLFGMAHPGPIPARAAPNIDVMALDVMDSLRFFAIQQLKVETLVNLALRNRAVESFFAAVPAIKPILTLYQVWHMLQLHGPKGDRTWDLAICDLPTSGFVQGMYQIPRTLQQAFRSGPVHNYAAGMREMLLDPQRTGLVLVTLPEDMPVVETLELQEILRKAHGVTAAALVLNGVVPQGLELDQLAALQALGEQGSDVPVQNWLWAARVLASRRARALALVPKLAAAVQGKLVQLPFLFRRDLPLAAVDELALHLNGQTLEPA